MMLDEKRWASMSLIEQMANIGSEVGRTSKWLSKDREELAEGAFLRALDLFDLTLKVGRISSQDARYPLLYELCRARDLFCHSYMAKDFDNLIWLDSYFGDFAAAQRKGL